MRSDRCALTEAVGVGIVASVLTLREIAAFKLAVADARFMREDGGDLGNSVYCLCAH